jgi:hypothetical protein
LAQIVKRKNAATYLCYEILNKILGLLSASGKITYYITAKTLQILKIDIGLRSIII